MKRYSLSARWLLSLCFLTGVAYAGRGGSPEEKGHPSGGGGSSSFRPEPAPHEEHISRPPTEHFERPSFTQERHAEPMGHASVLPSVSAPARAPQNEFHAPPKEFHAAPTETHVPANEFRAPTNEFRPPTNESRPPANEFRAPSAPANARVEPHDDFLGMHGEEHAVHSTLPTHPVPTTMITPGLTHAPNVYTPFRPTITPGHVASLPNPPGRPERGVRPAFPPHWQSVSNSYTTQFSHWSQANSTRVASFQANRVVQWNQIAPHISGRSWRGQFHSAQYREWRHNFWDFRRHRAEELWLASGGLYGSLFDDHWWSTCWWRHRPWYFTADVPPWWWWNAPAWADEAAFFGPDLGPAPIAYDPGTNVFYNDGSYDVDGVDQGPAADAAQQAIDLSNAPVDDYPVPEPAPPGQPQAWLPLGSWALTQQEQGDAVLYFQISVDHDGIVAGGYKNALTGDEQPIVGRLDKRSQRLAWHIANNPQTVFETGLSDLSYDVAGVFVHFGSNQTQNWLLVRLPSPNQAPGPATIPPEGS